MSENGLLVFVTFEIFPFTVGGIGRFIYNTLKHMTDEERSRTVVVSTNSNISQAAFEAIFAGARLVTLSDEIAATADPAYVVNTDDVRFAISNRVLLALKSLAVEHTIDYIEFPDWGGFGFATLQERLARGFLQDTQMAIRLHSTEAILVMRESRQLEGRDLRWYDLERKCLLDCDLIVGHLEPVAEETRRCFGIPEELWWNRVNITPPPVVIGRDNAAGAIVPDLDTPIIFTSKFQEFKRPQIFVQGAIGFLRAQPDYRGSIILICGGLDNDYARKILSLIPQNLRSRFKLMGNVSAGTRDDIVSNAIAAFPTTFESFCLAAYEASLLGGVVVLNNENPAFGSDTPWLDGVNCIKFDGSAVGLVRALQTAVFLKRSLQAVEAPPVRHPWTGLARRNSAAPTLGNVPLVTAVLVNQNQGIFSADTLESLAAQSYPNLEVVFVDDGSDDPPSEILRDCLTSEDNPRLTVVRQEMTAGVAAARNWITAGAKGEYLLYLNPGDILGEEFIATGVAALERNKNYDVYVPQVSVYSHRDDTAGDVHKMKTFVGEAPISGTLFNYYAEGPRICRTSTTSAIRHRATLGHLSDWGWMHDAVLAGVRVIASTKIEGLVRNHIQSDLSEPVDQAGRLYHLLVANSPYGRSTFPIAAFSQLSRVTMESPISSQIPDWQRHMIEHGYEGEVEFVASILGNTGLGKFIRSNQTASRVIEKSIRWLTGFA